MILMAHEVRFKKGDNCNIPDSFFHILICKRLHKNNKKRQMDVGNSSQSFSAGKGSRQRLAAIGKGKACERFKKVRKSLTILGK